MCGSSHGDPLSTGKKTKKKKYKIVIVGDQMRLVDTETGEVREVIHAVNGKLRGEEKEEKYIGRIEESETVFFLTFHSDSNETNYVQVNIYSNKCFRLLLGKEILDASYEDALEEYVLKYKTTENEFEFSLYITDT